MQTSLESRPLVSTRNLLLLIAWGLAMFGTLQVHHWHDLLGYSVCGPWGCGPPTTALIGYHGFWLIVLLLPAWLMKQRLGAPNLRRIGVALMVISLASIVALLASDCWRNWQHETMRGYMWQRCLFRLATYVEFPLAQLGLIGWWLKTPMRKPKQTDEAVASDQPHA